MTSTRYKGAKPSLTPEVIMRRINEIQDHELKQCIACLVWWDIIGIHPRSMFAEEVHNFFEPMLDMRPVANPPYNEIVKGLMWMGYLRPYAMKRALDDINQDRKSRKAKKILNAILELTANEDLSLVEIAQGLMERKVKTVNNRPKWRPSTVQIFLRIYGNGVME